MMKRYELHIRYLVSFNYYIENQVWKGNAKVSSLELSEGRQRHWDSKHDQPRGFRVESGSCIRQAVKEVSPKMESNGS